MLNPVLPEQEAGPKLQTFTVKSMRTSKHTVLQHTDITPEIEEQLGYAAGYPIHINFTPHLVPMNRGILVTAYASLKRGDLRRS